MADNQQRTPSTRSPLAGCSIIFVGIAAMIFLVAFVIWNLFKLDSEISKFTTDEAIPTPLADPVEEITAFNDFKSRLVLFKDAEGTKQDATLELSPMDINLAIASFVEFEELRGTFSVIEIKDGKLHIAISFPLRGKPMSEDMRYLNGTMIALPKLSEEEIILEIERIDVPDATVPDGFIGQMSPYRFSQQYVEDEFLGPWMKRLTDLSVKDGKVILTVIAETADLEEEPEDVSPYITRFLIVSACSAIIFGLVILLVTLSARKRKARKEADTPQKPEQL